MKSRRPFPPKSLLDAENLATRFVPAPAVVAWLNALFLDEGSKLYNPDHAHLRQADIAVLWTTVPNSRQMRTVLGMAEMVAFRCGKWQKARQEQQLEEWFGNVPDFLITLDANYCAQASDTEFFALVEHELYHCGQERYMDGTPKFRMDGGPSFAIRGHDVEEFVGVVRRYGVGSAAGAVAAMVEAGKAKPTVSRLNISRACGTCHLKAVA